MKTWKRYVSLKRFTLPGNRPSRQNSVLLFCGVVYIIIEVVLCSFVFHGSRSERIDFFIFCCSKSTLDWRRVGLYSIEAFCSSSRNCFRLQNEPERNNKNLLPNPQNKIRNQIVIANPLKAVTMRFESF